MGVRFGAEVNVGTVVGVTVVVIMDIVGVNKSIVGVTVGVGEISNTVVFMGVIVVSWEEVPVLIGLDSGKL